MEPGVDSAARFYYDLFSPWAYLAAEQVPALLGGSVAWVPVQARDLPGAETFDAFRCAEEAAILRSEVERRARELGIQPVVWPEPFPFDSALALRVATFASSIGRGTAFAQAAFRQAFAGGHDLSVPDHVLIAAAACEMHPAAVSRNADRPAIARALETQTGAAAAAGVTDVPALLVEGRVWTGERDIRRAAQRAPA